VIELDTMLDVVHAAERGVGIALVPEALCSARFESGLLVRIFPVELATPDSYFLVARAKDAQRPEVAAMSRWMLDHCARVPNNGLPMHARTGPEQRDVQTKGTDTAPVPLAAGDER
jgi:DNA-binding transcriptional LysR family regulator